MVQRALTIQAGSIQNEDITFLNERSVAEEVQIFCNKQPFTGTIPVKNGKIEYMQEEVIVMGQSLLNSADLVARAFKSPWLGNLGKYIINLSILFFAFTTIISWYYYANRSFVYLGGTSYLVLLKIAFVAFVFIGAITDTTLVWNFSNIAYAFMTIPNLVGIILLRKDMKISYPKRCREEK